MSNDEAKFLLNAYRPNGADAQDPAFGPALEQAKSDPTLGAWFAHEQAHAAAVGAKLRNIAPPPGLREAILAGGHATERVSTTMTSRRRAFEWMALAASIALLVAVTAVLWPNRVLPAAKLTQFAMVDAQHGPHLTHGTPAQRLEAELSESSTHLSHGVSIDFRKLAGTGCRTLNVGGRDVLEVCFTRNGAEFHCYIGRARDFGGSGRQESAVRFVQEGAVSAATWTRGAFRYVVVGGRGIDALKQLL